MQELHWHKQIITKCKYKHNGHILLLKSATSSMRNPIDCSSAPKSEIRELCMLFPAVPLREAKVSNF